VVPHSEQLPAPLPAGAEACPPGPAVVGVLLLGDQTRASFLWAGFVIATAAALMLARFGDLTEDTAAGAPVDPGAGRPGHGAELRRPGQRPRRQAPRAGDHDSAPVQTD
jgi:hypothetical protein